MRILLSVLREHRLQTEFNVLPRLRDVIIHSECIYADWPSRKAEPGSWNTDINRCDRKLVGLCTGVGQLGVQKNRGARGSCDGDIFYRRNSGQGDCKLASCNRNPFAHHSCCLRDKHGISRHTLLLFQASFHPYFSRVLNFALTKA